jgi:hypothetical protein
MKEWNFKWDEIYDVDPTGKCEVFEGESRINPKYPIKPGQIGRFRTGYYTVINGAITGIGISNEFKQYLEDTKHTLKVKVTEKKPTIKTFKVTKANLVLKGIRYPIEVSKAFSDEKSMIKIFHRLCVDNKQLYKNASTDVATRLAIIKRKKAQFELEVHGKYLISSDLKEIRNWLRAFYMNGKTRKPREKKTIVVEEISTKKTSRSERPAVKKDIEFCRKRKGDGTKPTAFEEYCASIEAIKEEYKNS